MLSRQTTPKGEANILLTYVCGVAARCCGETRWGCLAPNAAHDLLVHRFAAAVSKSCWIQRLAILCKVTRNQYIP